MQRGLILVEVFDKLGDAALVIKFVRALRFFSFILDRDANTFVEKRFFSQTL